MEQEFTNRLMSRLKNRLEERAVEVYGSVQSEYETDRQLHGFVILNISMLLSHLSALELS